jgi:hypothetical protein
MVREQAMTANNRTELGVTTARILVVGVEPDLFDIGPILSRTCFEVYLAKDGKDAIDVSTQHSFSLIVVYHPLPDMRLEEFNAIRRGHDSASARSQLLVLSEDSRLEEAFERAGKGPGVVLSIPTLVYEVESELLGVAARVATRLLIRLDVQLQEGTIVVVGKSEDVSRTGMLVRTSRSYPLGTMVRFETVLPGDPRPVQGEAKVIHHTLVGIERAPSLGLKFISFKNRGFKRLRAFVRRRTPSL